MRLPVTPLCVILLSFSMNTTSQGREWIPHSMWINNQLKFCWVNLEKRWSKRSYSTSWFSRCVETECRTVKWNYSIIEDLKKLKNTWYWRNSGHLCQLLTVFVMIVFHLFAMRWFEIELRSPDLSHYLLKLNKDILQSINFHSIPQNIFTLYIIKTMPVEIYKVWISV